MRIAINAIILDDNKLLVLKEKEAWILPGGKPLEGEEKIPCLMREGKEELSGNQLYCFQVYHSFEGTTPHQGDILRAYTYFAYLGNKKVRPSAEIKEARWMTYENITENESVSNITRKVADKLHKDGYI